MPEGLDAINALQRLEHGELIPRLYDALTETTEEVLRAAVKNNTKITKGKVTLTIEIIHDRTWDELQFIALAQLTKSLPKTEPQGATFYHFEGNWHRDDPRADPLPLFREVVRDEPAGRDVEPAAAAISREV